MSLIREGQQRGTICVCSFRVRISFTTNKLSLILHNFTLLKINLQMELNIKCWSSSGQQVSHYRWIWGIHWTQASTRGTQPGFTTQGRRHQKFKSLISVAPQEGPAALQNFLLKKILPGYVSTTALRRLNSVLSMDTSVSLEMNSSVQVMRSWPQPMLMLCSGVMVIPSAKRTPPPQSRDLHCKNVSHNVISNTVQLELKVHHGRSLSPSFLSKLIPRSCCRIF